MADKSVSFTVRVQDAASAALAEISNAADRVTAKLFSFKDILVGLTSAAGAFSLGAIIKDIVDLGVASDETFRQISSALPSFTEGIGGLRDGIDALATSTGNSLEALQATALQIAQSGAGSAQEVQQRLAAATTFADATGASLQTSAQLLTQVSREFGVSGDQALQVMANIAAAARGHVGIDDLMTAFQRATPIFHQFGIDIDTGTRAIVALLQHGDTARSLGKDLGQIVDQAGFTQLASEADIASDSLDQLTKRAKLVEDGAANSATAIKNEFVVALEAIGDKLHINDGLKAIADTLRFISTYDFSNILKLASVPASAIPGIGPLLAAYMSRDTGAKLPPGAVTYTQVGGGDTALSGYRNTNPLAVIDTKTTEAAAKALQAVDDELTKLLGTTDQATSKSQQFGDSILAWVDKAQKAKMPTDDIQLALGKLYTIQGQLQNQEVADAFQKLNDAVFATEGPVGQLNKQMTDLFAALDKGRAVVVANGGDVAAYDATVQQLRTTYGAYHDAVVDATQNTQLLQKAQSDLDDATADLDPNIGKLTADLAELRDKANDVAAKLALAVPDSQAATQYRQELEKILALIKQMSTVAAQNASVGQDPPTQSINLQKVAAAWDAVGRSIVAAAQAMGAMDAKTAATLQNVVSLGAGIAKIFTGDVVGGVAEGVTALAGAISSLFSHGPSAAQQQQTKDIESNTQALENLGALVRSGQVASSLGGLTAGTAQLALTSVKSSLAGGFSTAQQIDAVEAAAKAFGITMDGSAASFKALEAAIEEAMPQLQKAADEQNATNLANAKLAAESAGAFTLVQQQQLARDQLAEQQREEMQTAQDKRDQDAAAGLDTTTDDAILALLKTKDALEQVGLAAKQAADTISAAESQIAQNDDVYGTDATTSVGEYAKAYNIDLSAFDLTTKAGADAAISYLQGLYGQVDPNDPNATLDRHEIQQLIDKIRALPVESAATTTSSSTASPTASTSAPATPASSTGTSVASVTQISSAQADTWIGLMTTEVSILRSIEANTRSLLSGPMPSFNFGNGPLSAIFNFYIDNQQFDSWVQQLGSPRLQKLLGDANGQGLTRTRASGGATRR